MHGVAPVPAFGCHSRPPRSAISRMAAADTCDWSWNRRPQLSGVTSRYSCLTCWTMVFDHGINENMETMPISKFKATCLATLERVRRTGRPLRVTRFGKPVADIVPPAADRARPGWLGGMRGTARITGDITVPSSTLVKWDALK